MKSLLMVLLFTFSISFAITGKEVAQKSYNADNGTSVSQTIKMILINKRGKERNRELYSISKEYGKDSKSLLFFKKPADVKGVGLLSWSYESKAKEDKQWLYMPSQGRVRRISSSKKDGSFMGSDFSYNDLTPTIPSESNHKLISESEIIDGVDCWVIESVLKNKKKSKFPKKKVWIIKESLLMLKADIYDKRGILVKTMAASGFKKIDGIWTISKIVMETKKKKHKTVLEFLDVKYNQKFNDNLFKERQLKKGLN